MSSSSSGAHDNNNSPSYEAEETIRLVPLPSQQDNEYLLYQKPSASTTSAAAKKQKKKRTFTSNLVVPLSNVSATGSGDHLITPTENEVMTARYLTPSVITVLSTPPSFGDDDNEGDDVGRTTTMTSTTRAMGASIAAAATSAAAEASTLPTFITGREIQPLWRVIIFCCLPIGINMATWFSTGVLFPLQVRV